MTRNTLNGILLDERIELTLPDLRNACSCSTEWVIQLVDEGVIEPRGNNRDEWRFAGSSLSRALTATRLKRDLGLNLPGVALALDMLDEIETLRVQMRYVEIVESDK